MPAAAGKRSARFRQRAYRWPHDDAEVARLQGLLLIRELSPRRDARWPMPALLGLAILSADKKYEEVAPRPPA